MSDAIELISDGEGLAVFGDPDEVESFLSSAGVASREIPLHQLRSGLIAGSGIAQAGSHIAANSGRWVKLTEKSAEAMKVSQLMKGSSSGVRRAVTTAKNGKVTGILEFVKPGSVGSILTNPAILAGAAGIMAQFAMQQTMDEITDYLATIDEKVDDILRAQKDAAVSEVIGVGFMIDEAMTLREYTGRVSDVTWSKVQGASQTVATAQGYALRQLDSLAERLEQKQRNVGDVAEVASAAETSVEEWLAVLARCFQLQDGLAVLELDRVLDTDPAELERHRVGLQAAREKRRGQIATTTNNLLARVDAAANAANGKALLHPFKSGTVVRSGNEVANDVVAFNERIGVATTRQDITAKRWAVAAGEARDKAVETGTETFDAVRGIGMKTIAGAKAVGEGLPRKATKWFPRSRSEDTSKTDETA